VSVDGVSAAVSVSNKDTVLEVFGACGATATEVAQGLGTSRTGRWKELTRWPGSYQVVLRAAEQTCVLGDLAGARPVYLGSDTRTWGFSATAVAARTSASVETAALAVALVMPTVWSGMTGATTFRGVHRVLPGVVLRVPCGGAPGVLERFWSPEFSEEPLEQAGLLLRAALAEGVRLRTGRTGPVTCDLSGGLDSTSVALLAGRERTLRAVTVVDEACANDEDVILSGVAATACPGLEHVLVPAERRVFDDLMDAPATDQPLADACRWAMRSDNLRLPRDVGSAVHLTGSGGDTVLTSSPLHLLELARRRELGSFIRQTAAWARRRHRPVASTVSTTAALSRQSLGQVLQELALQITAAGGHQDFRRTGPMWVSLSRAARWLTDEGRRTVTEVLLAHLDALAPDQDPGEWAMAGQLWEFGAYQSELDLQNHGIGAMTSSVYLDNQVVRAVHALPWHLRQDGTGTKRQLVVAMAGLLPAAVASRTTKNAYTAGAYQGLRRNRRALHDLLDGSVMGAASLIDIPAVRGDLNRLVAGAPGPLAALETLCALELWVAQHRGLPGGTS
jgi:asparagine synthase (glutamine-hydrolysing)